MTGFRTVLQIAAIMLIALVAGSTFGIWRGYDPAAYSDLTFLEVHQGAVRGLNVLLPVMGAGALLLTGILAAFSRRERSVVVTYLAAFALMAAAGAITRLANQPINAEVMSWTRDAMPANWAEMRDAWWNWHILRTFTSVGGLFVLVLAVFADRRRNA
jgi:hypothetical protein